MSPPSLVIEEALCWGCQACQVACKQENQAPTGTQRIRVWEDGPREKGGRLETVFRVTRCRHCEDPACVEACPVDAIIQRQDGVVILDQEACTGCGSCVDACPYGAVVLNEEEGLAYKCNLCHHRVDQGLVPACADNICLAHCIQFQA